MQDFRSTFSVTEKVDQASVLKASTPTSAHLHEQKLQVTLEEKLGKEVIDMETHPTHTH